MASAGSPFLNRISLPAAAVPGITLANLQEIELVHVTGGCYSMGAGTKAWSGDTTPAHEVCVDDYYMGKYEVTQAQWRAVMGSNPSSKNSCGDNCPVVDVSWNEAQEFTRRLNQLTGKNYRLPTEAEWEYAVSTGGTQAKNEAANAGNSDGKRELRPVGWSQANGLGIYDMQGSVWEWTSDRYNRNYYKTSAKNNPEGPTEGNHRVLRGGSWSDNPDSIQATLRMSYGPWVKRTFVGFRLLAPDQLSAKYRDPAIAPIENANRNVRTELQSKL
jgi:formylglycine-generating enzyme required for sulfatase activity